MASIGALFANLTFETAAFFRGIDQSTARLRGMQRSFAEVGGKMASIGGKLSMTLTAPIAAIGATFLHSAKQMADGVKDIEKAAQLSGAGFEQFQRLSHAAKSVGLEGDKLADIYKDVNDKFGEFAATGGGELKDFFTNIAPKVGLTADAFKKLSGPEALQAYYNALEKAGLSQQQITFYMEALANDATALAPLLRENGKAMDELGSKAAVITPEDAERMKAYTQANQNLETAMQKLTIAFVNSGLMEAITSMVEKVAQWAGQLAKTNPEMLKWGTAIAAVAAAFGPALAGIGGIVSGLGSMIPLIVRTGAALMTLAMNPVGAVITGIALAVGAVYLAWKNWDKIEPILRNLYNGVKTWVVDRLNALWAPVKSGIETVRKAFYNLYDAVVGHSYVPDMVDEIGEHMARLGALMVDPADKLTKSTAEKFRDMAGQISGVMDSLYPEVAALRTELENLALLEGDKNTPMAAILKQRQRVADASKAADEAAAPALERPASTLPAEIQALPSLPKATDGLSRVNEMALSLRDTFDQIGGKTGQVLGDLADGLVNAVIPALSQTKDQADAAGASISQMGQGLTSLFSAIFGKKAGGIMGAIGTVAMTAFGGFRAEGGSVSGSKAYVVGENGPELFMPGISGFVVPNSIQEPFPFRAGGGCDNLAIAA